jgi:hypothetical protein
LVSWTNGRRCRRDISTSTSRTVGWFSRTFSAAFDRRGGEGGPLAGGDCGKSPLEGELFAGELLSVGDGGKVSLEDKLFVGESGEIALVDIRLPREPDLELVGHVKILLSKKN